MRRCLPLLLILACNGAEDTDDSSDDGVANEDGTSSPSSDLVDAQCIDGQWSEPLADPDADIRGAIAAFDAGDPTGFLIDALALRYPTGAYILDNGIQADGFGGQDCVSAFTSPNQRGSAGGMLGAASTLVHECGHFLDIDLGGFFSAAYVITEDLTITCDGGSYNDTPLRLRINDDAWSSRRPPCQGNRGGGCDSYADIYLSGEPGGTFEAGEQGIDTVIEEAVQYVNSLATDYALADELPSGGQISARDGILTFLWYIERYLAMMRTEDPSAYAAILDKACWREAILTVWGRAWLYLEATEGIQRLGIEDDAIEALVLEPELLREIQRVRDAEGC